MAKNNKEGLILLYQTDDGNVAVNVRFEDDTFWFTQKAMAELFDVQVPAINKHLKNIFDEGELEEQMVISNLEMTTQHGAIEGKTQKRRRAKKLKQNMTFSTRRKKSFLISTDRLSG